MNSVALHQSSSCSTTLPKFLLRHGLLQLPLFPPALLSKRPQILPNQISTDDSPHGVNPIRRLNPKRPVHLPYKTLRRSHLARLLSLHTRHSTNHPLQPHNSTIRYHPHPHCSWLRKRKLFSTNNHCATSTLFQVSTCRGHFCEEFLEMSGW